jgi:hypothetical protein
VGGGGNKWRIYIINSPFMPSEGGRGRAYKFSIYALPLPSSILLKGGREGGRGGTNGEFIIFQNSNLFIR